MTLVQDNSVQAINTALLSIKRDISASTATTAGTTAGLEPGKTYNINISGNAETATTAKTARTATNANHAETARTATNANHAETAETATKMSNALTVNGKTYNGSEAVDAGVQTVANGGTGVTTQAEINRAFISNLDVGESDVTDGTEFVSSWASDNGFSETTDGANTPYKRKFIKVWNYIKGKISSVLGLTKDNYGGKSAQAGFLTSYSSTRLKSGNIVPKDSSEYGGMRKDLVTSSMTDGGRPGKDGHVLTMFWDSAGRWDAQLFLNCEEPPILKARVKDNTADYGPWVDIATSAFARIPIGAPSQLEDGCIWIER